MQCQQCGQQNRLASRYCIVCGGPLTQPVAPPGASTGGALPGTQLFGPAGFVLVVGRPGEPELTSPLTKPTTSVGRAPTCDVVIDSPTVSHLHALVLQQQGAYILRDQGSRNGIYVGGQRVAEAPLDTRDPVRIPDSYGNLITLTLRAVTPSGSLQPVATASSDYLRVTHPLDAQRAMLTIGRDPANDITLDVPLVSRQHAHLERHGATWLLRDLHSTNGTYVNGQCLHGAAAVQAGDQIEIGLTRFVFQGSELHQFIQRPQIRIDAVDLVRSVGGRGGNIILNKVSLSILPQEFVALVGGSGAGKSTLLNALNGVAPAQSGTVLFNGQDFYRNPGPYMSMIGYVPQDDILHRELPVCRALDYAARLRLPPDTSPDERARRVDAVLADVKMEQQRNQLISRLSGGQRKRISIAVELLSSPSVLFLDEPTSGLDPGLDKTVMSLLQLLCDKGHTIALVTHATENIAVCTHVAFVAGRGRLVYYGPPADAPAFFGVSSFSDIYTFFDQGLDAAALQEQRFHNSSHYQRHVLDRQAHLTAPATTALPPAPLGKRQVRAAARRQWKILTQRYGELLWRDRVNLVLLLAQAPIVAVLLALVASSDSFTPLRFLRTEPLLLMLTLAAIWFGTLNAAREIVKERPIYLRERTFNLRIWPYVLSKFGVLALLSTVQALVLLSIVSLKTPHLPAWGILLPASLEMYMTLLLTALAGLACGLLISSLVSSTDRAMSIVPVVLIAQVVFSGSVFNLQGIADGLSRLAISRWCLSALGSTVDLNGLAAQSHLVAEGWPKDMYRSPDVLHLLGYWIILAAFTVVFLVGTYISLRRRDTRGT